MKVDNIIGISFAILVNIVVIGALIVLMTNWKWPGIWRKIGNKIRGKK